MEVGFELDLDHPLTYHRIYSIHEISNDDIAGIIEKIIPFKSIKKNQFDQKSMTLSITDKKTIKFIQKDDIEDIDQYLSVKLRMREDPVTQIIIDAKRTILGTEFLVKFLKELQKAFPKTAFSFTEKTAICGKDIQNIWIRKSFMKDPSMIEILELDDDEREKILKG